MARTIATVEVSGNLPLPLRKPNVQRAVAEWPVLQRPSVEKHPNASPLLGLYRGHERRLTPPTRNAGAAFCLLSAHIPVGAYFEHFCPQVREHKDRP